MGLIHHFCGRFLAKGGSSAGDKASGGEKGGASAAKENKPGEVEMTKKPADAKAVDDDLKDLSEKPLVAARKYFEHVPLDSLDMEAKKTVMAYLNEGNEGFGESSNLDVILYALFAISYIYFVNAFVQVGDTFNLKRTTAETLEQQTYSVQYADGNVLYKNLPQVNTLTGIQEWIQYAINPVFFSSIATRGDTDESGEKNYYNPVLSQTTILHDVKDDVPSFDAKLQAAISDKLIPFFDPTSSTAIGANILTQKTKSALCVNGYNCLLKSEFALARLLVYENEYPVELAYDHALLSSQATSLFALRQKALSGTGCIPGPTPPVKPHAAGFEYGSLDTTTTVAPNERYCEEDLNVFPFCYYRLDGQEDGYGKADWDATTDGKNRWECLLPTDLTLFNQVLDVYSHQDLIHLHTKKVVLQFATYNSQADTVVESELEFKISKGGQVAHEIKTSAFQIFPTYVETSKGLMTLVAGGIYLLLTAYFLIQEIREIMEEMAQKKLLFNKPWQVSLREHFSGDLFNALDIVSICISFAGIGVYSIYVLETFAFETEYSRLICKGKLDYQCPELPPSHPQYALENQQTRTNYVNFIEMVHLITKDSLLYIRVSAINTMLIGLRMLKFVRNSPRMIKLNTTLFSAVGDTIYLVLMLFIIMMGFVVLANRAFGAKYGKLSELLSALYYLMDFIIGNIEYKPLEKVDSLMVVFFVFPAIFCFHFVLLNMFFAITDRWYIVVVSEAEEVPSFNWKRRLKPYFGAIFSCIEWDEDFEMARNPDGAIKPKPPSRKKVVEEMKREVEFLVKNLQKRLLAQGKKIGKDLEQLLGAKSASVLSGGMFADDEGKPEHGTMLKQLLPHNLQDEKIHQVTDWSSKLVHNFVQKYHAEFLEHGENLHESPESRHQRLTDALMQDIVIARRKASRLEQEVRNSAEVYTRAATSDQITICKYIHCLEVNLEQILTERQSLEFAIKDLVSFEHAETGGGGKGNVFGRAGGKAGGMLGDISSARSKEDGAGSKQASNTARSKQDTARSGGAGSAAAEATADTGFAIIAQDAEGPPVVAELQHKKQGRKKLNDTLASLNLTAKKLRREQEATSAANSPGPQGS
ncbi:unnamed protein product [Amoebophrya sp. A120]|nr:unnamed protein product [Amoebophrya sp. A120]|eukprot:GSA120T00004160001.1